PAWRNRWKRRRQSRRDDQLDPRYGRDARLWPGRARAGRAGVPRRLGEARLGDTARDGRHPAVDDRWRTRLAGKLAAARLSRFVLLPALVSRAGAPRRRAWPGRPRRDRRRKIAASRHPVEPENDAG